MSFPWFSAWSPHAQPKSSLQGFEGYGLSILRIRYLVPRMSLYVVLNLLFSDSSYRGMSKQYPLTVLFESPISAQTPRLRGWRFHHETPFDIITRPTAIMRTTDAELSLMQAVLSLNHLACCRCWGRACVWHEYTLLELLREQTCHSGMANAVGCNCWLLIAFCWTCVTHVWAIPGDAHQGGGLKSCAMSGVDFWCVIFCP